MPPRQEQRFTPDANGVHSEPRPVGAPRFVARSPAFRETLSTAELYAPHDDVPVLLEGESGTGKTYLAQYIHLCSQRQKCPLEQVVLSALDDNLASSDLFGHVVGAFTDARHRRMGVFVSAYGGTVFLDEIGKASPTVQRKLLHVVERREVLPLGSDRPVAVDVRLVAATNVPLRDLTHQGSFLPDLFARVGWYRIRVPPLRERREDIRELVKQLLSAHAAKSGYACGAPAVDATLMDALVHAEWPLNLRELEATVRLLLITARGAEVITLAHCRGDLAHLAERSPKERKEDRARRVVDVFRTTRNVSETARQMHVARSTVQRHLDQAGLRATGRPQPPEHRAD